MMNYRIIAAALLLALSTVVQAQEAQEIEPGVDTSAPVASDAIEPGVNTSADAPPEPSPAVSQSTRARAIDSLSLDTSQITGNQELPQVLYIVPWKASDLGDLVGRPVNTLLDEVLAPADREVLKRQISYYEDLHGDDAGEDSR